MIFSIRNKITQYFKKLGPGVVTAISDDDPSGIATYSQAGAAFGLSFLWTALLTYPLMYALQAMCARIGIISTTGLAGIINKHYRKVYVWLILVLVVPAIILNIAADIASMGAVLNLLIPQIQPIIFDLFIVIFTMVLLAFFKYQTIANVLKFFCLALSCYLIVPFLVTQEWNSVFSATIFPQIKWEKDYLLLLVAILGTTISPYLFFWQSSMSLEASNRSDKPLHKEIKDMEIDVHTGMFASNLAMYFIILTTATVLHQNGITNIQTVEQAAQALEPLAGEAAYLIFSLGVLGVGFLSIPVLAACIGYLFAEIFGWKRGLDKKPWQAKKFFGCILGSLILGFAINLFGIDPVQSLIVTAVIYGLITPFLIGSILVVCNNKAIMGPYTNTFWLNVFGGIAFLVMAASAIAYLAFWMIG